MELLPRGARPPNWHAESTARSRGYSITWSACPYTDRGIVRPGALDGLEVDHELEAPASLRIKTGCRARPDRDQSEHSKDADRSAES